jgi:hypothetical protein
MSLPPTPPKNTRLGFHYYPDTSHFRKCDLETWLPELQALGISWLVLEAPASRAIPEYFLCGLLEAGIEPVLQLHLPLDPAWRAKDQDPKALELLFSMYAQWGLHYILPFDRPNLRSAWPAPAWAQADLVERFLDLYLPVAQRALEAGLTPVFPLLEPGGDYWDTAFLRAALRGLQRRGHDNLLKALVLSALARTDRRLLSWGAGGPERWPGKRPYSEAGPGEDQQGFYIFDWYLAVAQAALGIPLPLLLFGAGKFTPAAPIAGQREEYNLYARAAAEEEAHTRRSLALAQVLSAPGNASGEVVQTAEGPLDPVSPHVLACNLWLLAARPESPHASEAWYSPAGDPLPAVAALRQWRNTSQEKV